MIDSSLSSMVTTKILTSLILLAWGWRILEGQEEGTKSTTTINSQVLAKKEVPPPNVPSSTPSPTPPPSLFSTPLRMVVPPRERHSSEREISPSPPGISAGAGRPRAGYYRSASVGPSFLYMDAVEVAQEKTETGAGDGFSIKCKQESRKIITKE